MTYFLVVGSWIWTTINSNFAVAFVGGLTGAFGGALGAQHIAERAKRREELLKELRNTNAAIMVSFSICNAALALKKQHVLPLKELFLKEKDALLAFKEKRKMGEVLKDAEHRIAADLRTFPALTVPIDTLKSLVYERISAYGRPLATVSVLEQALVGLTEGIRRRDEMVNRFTSRAIPAEHFPQYYFGLPLATGDTNQEYPDLVEGIYSYVDDVAFFSSLLCVDLIKHGQAVRTALTKRSEKNVPKVSTADFSGPKAKTLIPSEDQYSDWINSFTEIGAEKAGASI